MNKKRSTTLCAILLFSTFLASAQTLIPQANKKEKWGYVDESGTVKIKYQYDFAGPFENGKAQVEKGDVKGFIAPNGKPVGKIEYSELMVEAPGVWRVAVGGKWKDGALDGAKWGFINDDVQYILRPEYDEIGSFRHSMAWVRKGSAYGFIDNNYSLVVKPQYSAVGSFNDKHVAWVNTGGKMPKGGGAVSGGKWGVIDRDGSTIIAVNYKALGTFTIPEEKPDSIQHKAENAMERLKKECGEHRCIMPVPISHSLGSMLPKADAYAVSQAATLTNYGILDAQGGELVPVGKYISASLPEEGYSVVTQKKKKVETTHYLKVATGDLSDGTTFKTAYSFRGGLAVAIDQSGKWCFVGKDLKAQSERYDWISPRMGSLYLVRSGETMAVVDADTQCEIASGKKLIFPPASGYMACCETNGQWHYLNLRGKAADAKTYDYAYSFRRDMAVVKSGELCGIIDKNLSPVIETKWKDLNFPSADNQQYFWVADPKLNEDSWLCLDRTTGRQAFPATFENAGNFRKTDFGLVAPVVKGGKYGGVNTRGELVVPMQFTAEKNVEAAIRFMALRHITTMKPVDAYRFNIYTNEDVYRQRLAATIDSSLWDY